MIKKFLKAVFFILMSLNIHASEDNDLYSELVSKKVVYFERTQAGGASYDILVFYNQNEHHLSIYKEGESVLTLSRGAVTEAFKEVSLFIQDDENEVYALTLWQNGVHGETIEVYEINSSKKKLSQNSSWPIEYVLKDGILKFKAFGDLDDQGEPKEVKGSF